MVFHLKLVLLFQFFSSLHNVKTSYSERYQNSDSNEQYVESDCNDHDHVYLEDNLKAHQRVHIITMPYMELADKLRVSMPQMPMQQMSIQQMPQISLQQMPVQQMTMPQMQLQQQMMQQMSQQMSQQMPQQIPQEMPQEIPRLQGPPISQMPISKTQIPRMLQSQLPQSSLAQNPMPQIPMTMPSQMPISMPVPSPPTQSHFINPQTGENLIFYPVASPFKDMLLNKKPQTIERLIPPVTPIIASTVTTAVTEPPLKEKGYESHEKIKEFIQNKTFYNDIFDAILQDFGDSRNKVKKLDKNKNGKNKYTFVQTKKNRPTWTPKFGIIPIPDDIALKLMSEVRNTNMPINVGKRKVIF